MLNLFKKKKQVKKAATAADFNNSGIGMALKVMPFLPLALLVLSMALSAFSPKGDAIIDSNDTIEVVNSDPNNAFYISNYLGTRNISGARAHLVRNGYSYYSSSDGFHLYKKGTDNAYYVVEGGKITNAGFIFPGKGFYNYAKNSDIGRNGNFYTDNEFVGFKQRVGGFVLDIYYDTEDNETWWVIYK